MRARILKSHHLEHLADLGYVNFPLRIRYEQAEYDAAWEAWLRSGITDPQLLEAKALGHIYHRQQQQKDVSLTERAELHQHFRSLGRYVKIGIGSILLLLIFLFAVALDAHCQFSHVNNVTVTDGTTSLFTAAPFKIMFAGCSVSGTGSAMVVTCGSGGTNNPGGSDKQVQYNNGGTAFGGIAFGTSGQILESCGTNCIPSFQDPIVSGPDSVAATPTKNPVQIGCLFLTTPATLTNNQVGALQCDNVQDLLVKIVNSITVNAGTNLNTSALALETGGNLASIKTDVDKIPTSPSTDRTTAAAPFAFELSDGAAFYTAAKTGQLPAALDGSGFLKTHEQGALPAGTNVIGHVIADTGSTTAVTALPAIPTGSNVIGHVIADTGSTTAVTALPAIPSGSNVIGHVIADTGSTTAVTALPATPAGSNNIGSVNLGTTPDQCGPGQAKSYAIYDAATNGATQIVALSSGKIVYVCAYYVSSSSTTANTIKLVYGTGSNCATGQTAITPGRIVQAGTSTGPAGFTVADSHGLATIASNELCVLTNAAQAAQVEVSYIQQ